MAALQNTGYGNDIVTDIENVTGTAFADVLTGSSVASSLTGKPALTSSAAKPATIH